MSISIKQAREMVAEVACAFLSESADDKKNAAYAEALSMAAEALERAEPVEPQIEGFMGKHAICGRCPVCGARAFSDTSKCCGECGQRFSWPVLEYRAEKVWKNWEA